MPPKKKIKARHASEVENSILGGIPASVTDHATLPQTQGFASKIDPEAFLQALGSLSSDLQFKIFEQLHPQDLLDFAETCEEFSSFLLSFENKFARMFVPQNADNLPERPPFLKQSAFVHLLYSPHCHHCRSIAREINWEWYTRVCPRCLPRVSYGADDVRTRMRAWSNFLPQVDPLERLFDAYNLRPGSDSRGNNNGVRFYKYQVDGFLKKLPSPDTTFSCEAQARAQKVVMKHAGDVWMRSMYRGDLRQWSVDQGPNRDTVLKERREQRFADVIKRLRGSGWGGELDYLDRLGILSSSLSRYDVVGQSNKLTERGWLEVQEAVKSFLESTRKERLEIFRASFSNLEEAIISHCVQVPRNAVMDCRPYFIDLAMNEDIRAVIEYPGTTIVTPGAFSPLVPSLVADWHAERKKELTEFFRRYLGPIPDDIDPLSLATAAIVCTLCHDFSECSVYDITRIKFLRYPDILAHGCMRLIFPREFTGVTVPYHPDKDFYAKAAMTTWLRPLEYSLGHSPDLLAIPFSVAPIPEITSVLNRKFVHLRDVVSALGLDPSRATVEDLRLCKARLRCLTCNERFDRNLVRSGESAMRHALGHSEFSVRYHESIKWECIGGEDLAAAHAKEAVEWKGLSLYTDCVRWACSLCPDWSIGPAWKWIENLSSHLNNEHNISDDLEACVKGGVIYPHPGHSNVLLAESVHVPIGSLEE